MHEIPLITTIALALSAALFFGLIVRRLGLSPIVGYLIAGVLIGPYTPGVVGDAKIASQPYLTLAQIEKYLHSCGLEPKLWRRRALSHEVGHEKKMVEECRSRRSRDSRSADRVGRRRTGARCGRIKRCR